MNRKKVEDSRGILVKWDLNLSTTVSEVFWVSNVPAGTTRGRHAHRFCHQTIILLKGELQVTNENCSGIERIHLGQQISILEIPKLTWSEQIFLTHDTEIIVLCSTKYDESEYVRDYREFKSLINEENPKYES